MGFRKNRKCVVAAMFVALVLIVSFSLHHQREEGDQRLAAPVSAHIGLVDKLPHAPSIHNAQMFPWTENLLVEPVTYPGGVVTADDLELVALSIAKKKGLVLFTVINQAYVQFANSWLCNTAGLGDLHDTVLFLTTEVEVGQRLLQQWPALHVVAMNNSQYQGPLLYSTAAYVRLMVERTRLIQRLLRARVRLLLFELDFVWLTDPVPAVLAQSRQSESDIVATRVFGTELACGCFLLINPTKPSIKLWAALTQMMEKLYSDIAHSKSTMAVSEATNDQTYLSVLLSQRHSGVQVSFLPERLFPDGIWYQNADVRALRHSPLIIHNNWIMGNAAKVQQFKLFGHWFLSENSTLEHVVCNTTALHNLGVH